jgi:DNA-binding transcriptional ArsR family regulator
MPGANMGDFMAVAKALADENRVRMLMALRGRELCLYQIVELVVLAPSTTSKHMSILRQAGLVEGHKSGRWIRYRLADDESSEVVRKALQWMQQAMANDPRILRDAKRVEEILQLDLQRLCESRFPQTKTRNKLPPRTAKGRARS